MNLRLASLDAYAAFNALMAPGWCANPRLDDCLDLVVKARSDLRWALGIAPLYVEHDKPLDELGLLAALAESLARRDETKMLAGAINAALRQHASAHEALKIAAE